MCHTIKCDIISSESRPLTIPSSFCSQLSGCLSIYIRSISRKSRLLKNGVVHSYQRLETTRFNENILMKSLLAMITAC